MVPMEMMAKMVPAEAMERKESQDLMVERA